MKEFNPSLLIKPNIPDYACIISDKLYFGNQIFANNINELKELGITLIIDLIKYKSGNEKQYPSDIKYIHKPIIDLPSSNIDFCEELSLEIDKELKEKNKKVYVHCAQGISRSATLIIYYIMTREKKNFKDTLNLVRSLRSVVCPTTGFIECLSELDKKLYGQYSLTKEDYSIECLKFNFQYLEENEIKKTYEESKEIVKNNINELVKRLGKNKLEDIDQVGFLTYELLKEKYKERGIFYRYGCSEQHPFN